MAIIDEPVRGSVPPPWFRALPGLERMRALANGFVARPPLFELLDIRVGHVAPGSVTLTMPASSWLQNGYGPLDIQPFIEAALTAAATTGLSPGLDLEVVSLFIGYLRPVRPHAGNLLARARLVNASRFFVYAEVEVEDANGRRVLQAASQSAIRIVEPAPPAPSSDLKRIEEPGYPTPPPVRRAVPTVRQPPMENFLKDFYTDPLAAVRGFADGRSRSAQEELFGIRTIEVAEGRVVLTIPASEWQASFSRAVPAGTIALIANVAGSMAALTKHPPDTYMAGIDGHARFFGGVPADGRELRAEGRACFPTANEGTADISVYDADGREIGLVRGSFVYVREALREKRQRNVSKRVLATLLFADVVDSTRHAERLGDGGWRALIEEFRTLVRAEIGRTEGTEVDTAGDGFFVHFDSPGSAIDCARAIRDGVGRLGVEVRLGVHTGECEMNGGRPTGLAVHAAARIQTAASPGEILVSDTVKALATGSGLRFEARGAHELKGIPEPWSLHAVLDPGQACVA